MATMQTFLCSATLILALIAVVHADSATNTRDDRATQALSATQASIARAVSQGSGLSARAATLRGMSIAKMTTRLSADPWEFDGGRKLLDKATNTRSDRISQSMNAAHDAISRAVAGNGARWAADKNLAYSKLATKVSADAWEFDGRKLLDKATNTRSDRISQSMNAAHDAISRAVAGNGARWAADKNLAYSKLATKVSADAWEFDGRKLLDKATNTRSDRISQSMNAAHDAISRAVAGNGARWAADKNLAYSKLATKVSADAWEFDGRRRLTNKSQ